MKYRPDIDGLRAMAILSVILYHGFPGLCPGGFVGVDVFFVISGYLITSIILNDITQGNFSYRRFISRRVRRLFPAILAVMWFCLLVGYFLMFPHEFVLLGKHVAGAGLFVSNFILELESGYFDDLPLLKPLLHFWSLSIEEQFYIVWPFALVLLFRRGIGFARGFVVLAVILSFWLNLVFLATPEGPSAFYNPLTRAWELALGALLAIGSGKRVRDFGAGTSFANLLSLVGLALILYGIHSGRGWYPYPGKWALLPTVGTVLLIASERSVINRWLLSNRLLVYVGLISFPLYLWHWVLLHFAYLNDWLENHRMVTAVLAISVVISVVTYEFIEKWVKNNVTPERSMPWLLSLMMLTVGVGGAVMIFEPAPRNNLRITGAIRDWHGFAGLRAVAINGVEMYDSGGDGGRVLFWGDSKIQQYIPRLIDLRSKRTDSKPFVLAAYGGTPPIPHVVEGGHPECNDDHRSQVLAYALSDAIDSVVIGMYSAYFTGDDRVGDSKYRYVYRDASGEVPFEEGGSEKALVSLENVIRQIVTHKKVYLLIDNPSGPNFDPRNMYSGSRLAGVKPLLPSDQPYAHKEQELRDRLKQIATRTGAQVIDAPAHFLDGVRAAVVDDEGRPIYKDRTHIRPFYVRERIRYLDPVLLPGDS